MSSPEQEHDKDWIAIIKKNYVSIILIAIIVMESSGLVFTMLSSNQTQNQSNSIIQDLQKEYDDLKEEKDDLQKDYEDLGESYTNLEANYTIERCLRIGNSLESYYDYLRQEIGPTGAKNWHETPEESSWQLEVEFAANLGQHDLARIYWPSIEDGYYEAVGEYSYITARAKIDEVVDLIGMGAFDTATQKIQKILVFINQYISYETEVNDKFSTPVETLGFRSGDCDDYTILSTTLFEAVGINTAIGFFVNDNDEYHAMTLMHMESLAEYGYWYYPDLTDMELDAGKWIIIESQITLDEQDTDWMSEWSLFAAAPLDD